MLTRAQTLRRSILGQAIEHEPDKLQAITTELRWSKHEAGVAWTTERNLIQPVRFRLHKRHGFGGDYRKDAQNVHRERL
ncbi:MAG: hypothetical protein WBV39_13785 [Rudaea sp.]